MGICCSAVRPWCHFDVESQNDDPGTRQRRMPLDPPFGIGSSSGSKPYGLIPSC